MGVIRVCFVFLAVFSYVVSEEGPKVETKYGWVQGSWTESRAGRKIAQFLKIPYAQPPVDLLRFQSPQPPKPWEGVRNATQEGPVCLQQLVLIESGRNSVLGKEDCLYLNVFTPDVKSPSKLPVIVFIHGGAYVGLSSERSKYGPELLLDKDVVMVTMNYRVGVLSFLSKEDEVIPGNYGMKDQTECLKWVRDNICFFGGDQDSVTLMGESSGAASVHLHTLSPLSKGLFHKAIIESGSGLSPWGYSQPGLLRDQTVVVANLVGCPFSPSVNLLSCLQKLPVEKIVNTTHTFLVFDIDPVVIWNPAIEKSSVKDAFLTDSPWKLTSDVPLLAGFNFAEGGLKTCSVTSGNKEQKFKQWNEQFDTLTPISLLYDRTAPDPKSVTKAIRSFYFGTSPLITPNMTKQITEMYSDALFNNGVIDAVINHRGRKYLYFFKYNNSKSQSICPLLWENNDIDYFGACHMDEMIYLFPMDGTAPKMDTNSADYHLSVKLIELWVNFVKYSIPMASGVIWTPVKSEALEYLEISNTGFAMKSQPIKERRKFWKSLKLRS